MDNAGVFTLGDFSLGAAEVVEGDPLADLDGMRGFTAQVVLQGGSGTDPAATAAVFIQTSIDQGSRWCDCAVARFDSIGGVQIVTVEAETTLTPIAPPTDAALDDDSNGAIQAGVMGDRLRAKIVSTGTYAGQSVASVRVCVR